MKVAEAWVRQRMQAGLSSGEGLIWAVHDPIVKREAVREKGKPTGEYQDVVVDQGVSDKRLIVLEAEFASTLRVLGRDHRFTTSAHEIVRGARGWHHGRRAAAVRTRVQEVGASAVLITDHPQPQVCSFRP